MQMCEGAGGCGEETAFESPFSPTVVLGISQVHQALVTRASTLSSHQPLKMMGSNG